MKLLQEVLKGVHRIDDQPAQEADFDLDLDDDDSTADPTSDEDAPLDLDDDTTSDDPDGTSVPDMDNGGNWNAPAPSGGGGGFGGAGAGADPAAGGDVSLDSDEDQPGEQEDHPELDGLAGEVAEDPDRQGLIRAVKSAHLVYKRSTEDGTFEEMWIYNVTDMRAQLEIKKAILAGTDIPVNKMTSPDGAQTYQIWSAGNAEMLLIKGLPN